LVSNGTLQALQTIFNEIQAVFPSPYIHCGGDEVSFPTLARLPEVQAAIKAEGLSSVTDIYRNFIAEMDAYAKSIGKTLIVWEGFAPKGGQTGRSAHPASNVTISTDVIVSPFDCFYYPPPQLAADGYKILNNAWTPLYIAGGGGQAPELIYQWNPWLLGEVHSHLSWWTIPAAHRDAVVGVKMAVWQTTAAATLCALSTRVPAMSDRSWNPQAGRTYADYQVRVVGATSLLQKLIAMLPPGPAPPPPAPTPAPPPLPAPAAAGFRGEKGACRDKNLRDGNRLEHNGGITLTDCESSCLMLGGRTDAYDWGFQRGQGVWCGCWGSSFNQEDNQTLSNHHVFVYGTGPDPKEGVCQGNGDDENWCYMRTNITCTSPTPLQPGCLCGC
jgi:hypothetical protein